MASIESASAAAMPRWLRSAAVAWLGALLAAGVVALTAGFVSYEWRVVEEGELQSAELYARVLQDHAERTFDTIDIALASLAEGLTTGDAEATPQQLSLALTGAQAGLPFLRSLSLMTETGRVIASSTPGNVGARVDLLQVRLPRDAAVDALGSSVRGRDLADAAAVLAPSLGERSANGARTFVPLVRRAGRVGGQPVFIVAALNTDFFGNAYELTLADPSRGAALVTIDSVLLAASGSIVKRPGERIRTHRFFSDFLLARESGRLVGNGIDGAPAFTAFRMLRKRALLVVVERDRAKVAAAFSRTVYRAAGTGLAAVLVIGTMAVLAWRSLRVHENVRRKLELTRANAAEGERDMRALVESVHELIFRADAQGRITFVNGRWQQLTGRGAAEILGRRFASLCLGDGAAACDALFAPARSGSGMVLVGIATASGRRLVMELSVAGVGDAAGEATGFAGFAVDISEREAARQALESQLQFTAQLLEISPTPIFVKDVEGRFTTVNRAWLELMGLALPDVLGRRSADLFGASAPQHNDQDARLLQSSERLSYENRLHVAGREPRDTVVTKVRFTRADGAAAGIVGSIIDVTEFRDAERHIREARDAAALANGAKSEFIANISHELRTPLQAIIGFSELGADLAGAQADFLDLFTDIHAGGRRMLTLVNGLLDVSQMEGAVGSLALERSDLTPLIREAVRQLQPKAALRDQAVRLLGLDTPRSADVDPARFQQAVRNVLANAVRFAPVGSVIEVECAGDAVGGVVLTVRDHGPGIPDDELEAVFESFVQSTRTRDGSGGTGLGLTISRKIMSAHGGSVIAANAPGGGTLIRLALPAPGAVGAAPDDSVWQDATGLLYT